MSFLVWDVFWWCSCTFEPCVIAEAPVWVTEHVWNSCNHCFGSSCSLWLYWFFLFPPLLQAYTESFNHPFSEPRPCYKPLAQETGWLWYANMQVSKYSPWDNRRCNILINSPFYKPTRGGCPSGQYPRAQINSILLVWFVSFFWGLLWPQPPALCCEWRLFFPITFQEKVTL